jgi:hypothetical protein
MKNMAFDMSQEDMIPYFMWDYGLTVREIKEILASDNEPKRLQMMDKILRDARYADVWKFFSLQEFLKYRERLVPFTGRMRGFWGFMYDRWVQYHLIDRVGNSNSAAR